MCPSGHDSTVWLVMYNSVSTAGPLAATRSGGGGGADGPLPDEPLPEEAAATCTSARFNAARWSPESASVNGDKSGKDVAEVADETDMLSVCEPPPTRRPLTVNESPFTML